MRDGNGILGLMYEDPSSSLERSYEGWKHKTQVPHTLVDSHGLERSYEGWKQPGGNHRKEKGVSVSGLERSYEGWKRSPSSTE